MISPKEILDKLPYSQPFLFVDELFLVNENEASGCFTFRENLDFYKGHFKNHPITPGVILTECMAQIGVVSLGIFLLKENFNPDSKIVLTSNDIHFMKMVYPGEKVWVYSKKIYFRFGKLKCELLMKNAKKEEVCKGTISGMVLANYEQ
jgi:3-hydroxyacyl-[acyl-carrier-protein] dehydratase